MKMPLGKLPESLRYILAALALLMAGQSQAQEPIRIAFIDPLSGTFASVGTSGLTQLQFAADYLYNDKGGILGGRMIEIVPFDNKQSPTETQIQFRRAISEDIRIVFQGNSSAVANTLHDAVTRHNRRNPGQEILQINYSAVDPILTNEECSFWHFRFDSHAIMKLEVLTDFIAANEEIKSLYVIGQDYSFGHVVSETTEQMMAQKRPDLEIVGNEFHPIGQVKDFTPYVTKIVSSGADAVLTGNFGADMVSLARSIIDSGLEIPIYTFYAAYDGITATLGEDGKDQIHLVHNETANPIPTEERRAFNLAFKAEHPDRDVTQPRIVNALSMLVKAMEESQSTEPAAIASALEDMRFTTLTGDQAWMRADDHQLFQSLHISVHTDEGIEFDADNSGFGLRTIHTVAPEDNLIETSCRMRRPR
ncbi:MAG: branched-chain amino acid ABC transporter substrate-binding protein [Pseudomonadales bacterium]|nr:branched-chain amino acid ABC transporter substrate-binding protein [Pseudomonadales bacterium]